MIIFFKNHEEWISSKTIRKMKMITKALCFFTWVCAFAVSANVYSQSQKVSLTYRDVALKTVLKDIENQSNYTFLYSDEIDTDKKVTIDVKNLDVEIALKTLFEGTDLGFNIADNHIVIRKLSKEMPQRVTIQQGIRITGTVSDAFDTLLPGVNVVVQGTNQGTTTDSNGEFSITVPDEEAILVFTFVGYGQQNVAVGQRRILVIKMVESTAEIEEVVVVGYGVQRKVSITGALSQIEAKEILKISTPSMSNAIAGRIPGIITRQSSGEPGYDAAQVYIRGLATWGNTNPLILIDGVERDMNQINAQEIESFTVLKDASATAVYGARGANGVIIITTKRGQMQKPKVILRSEVAMLQPMRLPKYINGQEYAMLMNEAMTYNNKTPMWDADEIKKFGDGSDPYLYPNVDWIDEIIKERTFQTVNNLSVTGGGEIIRYYMNVGYTVQDGIYKEDTEYKYRTNARVNRYNFRNNIDVNLTKNFIMQLGLGGIIQTGNYPGSTADHIFNTTRMISPIAYPVFNPDGSLGGATSYVGWHPYGRVTQAGYSTQDHATLQGNFGVNWDLSALTQGLSARGLFAFDRYASTSNSRPKSFGVKRYLGKDPDTDEDLYSPWYQEEQPMGYSVGNSGNRAIYLETQINYNRTFSDIHNVTGMILFNQREYVALTAGNSQDNIPERRRGYAGRVTYSFDNRYLFEVNLGYNGSENFPKDKRYGFFPAASAGWVVTNEDFFNVGAVSRLKLRGSHGKVGNDRIGQRFIFITTVRTSGAQGYGFGDNQTAWRGMDENLIGNPNVTWEESTKTNIGLDLGLLDDKISLQVDFFNEYRKNILIRRGTLPQLSGIYPWSVPFGNLGEVKNRGFDALLEIKNTTQSGLFYSFQVNYTFARNEVVEDDSPERAYPYLNSRGYRLGQYFGFVGDGFFKDETEVNTSPSQLGRVRTGDAKYKDVNGDGRVDSYDLVAMGFARTPEMSFGFGGTVAYKGFDASVFFTGAANTTVNMGSLGIWPFSEGMGGGNVVREYYDNRWTLDTPNAKYPAVDEGDNRNNFSTSNIWMKNGNYLRLRNAEIGYTVPEKLLGKYNFGNIRVFVNGMNLYTWDFIKIMDPESNDGLGRYPLQRSFNVGLQIDFK